MDAITPLFINSRMTLMGLTLTRAAKSRTLIMLGISTIFEDSAILHLHRETPIGTLLPIGWRCIRHDRRLRQIENIVDQITLRVHRPSVAQPDRLAARPDRLHRSAALSKHGPGGRQSGPPASN